MASLDGRETERRDDGSGNGNAYGARKAWRSWGYRPRADLVLSSSAAEDVPPSTVCGAVRLAEAESRPALLSRCHVFFQEPEIWGVLRARSPSAGHCQLRPPLPLGAGAVPVPEAAQDASAEEPHISTRGSLCRRPARSGLIDGSGFARAAVSPRTLPAYTECHRRLCRLSPPRSTAPTLPYETQQTPPWPSWLGCWCGRRPSRSRSARWAYGERAGTATHERSTLTPPQVRLLRHHAQDLAAGRRPERHDAEHGHEAEVVLHRCGPSAAGVPVPLLARARAAHAPTRPVQAPAPAPACTYSACRCSRRRRRRRRRPCDR